MKRLYKGEVNKTPVGWMISVINIKDSRPLIHLESASWIFKSKFFAKRALRYEVEKMNRAFEDRLY